MGFVLRLCLLLLITEICVLANPVIPQSGLTQESPVPKSTIRKLFMMQDEDTTSEDSSTETSEESSTETSEEIAGNTDLTHTPAHTTASTTPHGTTTTEGATTKTPGNRSSLSTPSIILSVSALIPVFLVNKLGNNEVRRGNR